MGRMDGATRQVAIQRIQKLFTLANETIHKDKALAQRYAKIARRIAMSAKVRLPTEYRRQICRHCKSFILPGVNCRVRIQQQRGAPHDHYMLKLWQTHTNTAQEKEGENKTMSKLSPGTRRRVKRQLSGEGPTIWIGKSGVTQELIKEIDKQLDKNKMLKIRILKSALGGGGVKQIATGIAEQTGASLVECKGHTFMLFRRRKK